MTRTDLLFLWYTLGMENLIDNLVKEGWLRTPHIIEAFKKIKREDFLQEGMSEVAEADMALPIGYSQTISQPSTVAFMFEELKPKEGDKIMDVGSGSGWTTALLAEIVGEKGRVVGIEIVPKLARFGKDNVAKYSFIKKKIVKIVCSDASYGFQKIKSFPELEQGFDGILASASIGWAREKGDNVKERIPAAWQEQLKIGGRIVVPIDESIWVLEKISETDFNAVEHKGFVFVPMVMWPDKNGK